MFVKIITIYHGKYTSGPVFFVRIVLPEGRRRNTELLLCKWLAPSLPLKWFTGQKVLRQLYT
jgi:hypothetical protein